jgi:peptidoglycan-associated lipoprotein
VPASAQLALEQLATCLRASGGSVTIEGHAEEGGTPEYALVTAERRAKAVAKALGALGVRPGGITTRSYGQEKPVCTEPTDACHAKNRRAEAIPD